MSHSMHKPIHMHYACSDPVKMLDLPAVEQCACTFSFFVRVSRFPIMDIEAEG